MTEYEGPKIPGGGENPYSWSHKDIHNTFEPTQHTIAIGLGQKYAEAWSIWEQGLQTFDRSIQKSLDSAWTGGKAAPLAMQAIKNYVAKAHELSGPISEMQDRVDDASSAVGTTKSKVPGLVSGDQHWYNPWSWGKNAEKSEKQSEAREAMENDYVKPMSLVDAKIPVFPTPSSPTNPVDIPNAPPGGWDWQQSGDPGPSTPGPQTTPGPKTPGDPGPSTTDKNDKSKQPGTDNPSTNPTSTNPTTTQDPSTQNPSNTKTPTTPTGVDPTKTSPTSVNPTTTSPYVPGRPNSPSPGTTPGAPKTTTPAPRQNIPGLPGSPAATQAAAAAARNAAAAGTAGGFGMPGGARGKGDDDKEHKIPDYLINRENTEELLGEQPRTLPGGVIGTNPEFTDG
ncbi:hypothetical protein [Nocardia arthritidis]|uniref:PPE domain-containing protein n=1 Tax=Nocardia arthritidis TaxID=228602 RepID=A0A6G9YAV7_9NOCA|nr:hypothetical protein [Nocardia arthritidis]QIS10351.1 hypothetical protein F5544_12300 [Nocardia arthritidis]